MQQRTRRPKFYSKSAVSKKHWYSTTLESNNDRIWKFFNKESAKHKKPLKYLSEVCFYFYHSFLQSNHIGGSGRWRGGGVFWFASNSGRGMPARKLGIGNWQLHLWTDDNLEVIWILSHEKKLLNNLSKSYAHLFIGKLMVVPRESHCNPESISTSSLNGKSERWFMMNRITTYAHGHLFPLPFICH